MSPETLQKLKVTPEFQELRDFIVVEFKKLGTILDLADVPREHRELVIEGRLWAIKTLGVMLGPLLDTVDKPTGPNKDDYLA